METPFEEVFDNTVFIAKEAEKKTVLVVDDNLEFLKIIEEFLITQGLDVIASSRVSDAQQILTSQKPDIIISDIVMPEIDGYQFFDEIRSDKNLNDVPFIFLSALSDVNSIQKGRSLGSDDFLCKPFDPEELLSSINGKLKIRSELTHTKNEYIEKQTKRVVNTLSHEFRTPLVSIITGAELLLDRLEDLEKEQVEKLLRSIVRGGGRLQQLVDDFMLLQQIDSGYAKSLSGKMKAKYKFSGLVREGLEDFVEEFLRNEGSVEFRFVETVEAQEVEVEIFSNHFINIFHRILDNAVKFAGKHNPVVLDLSVADGAILLKVRDYGPGIEKEMFEEVCKTFSQLDREQHEQQGAGVGLSIANYLTTVNGGKLFFNKPDEGEGLEVCLSFPCMD